MHFIDTLFLWSIVILGCLFFLTVILLPTVIAYLLNRWFKRKGIKYIGLILLIVAPIWTAYEIYTAIYPTDSFYFSEFKTITGSEIPKSAMIIKKCASFPDMHGDYSSASLIQLSTQDYIGLLKELEEKGLTKNGELIRSSEFNDVMEGRKIEQIKSNFVRKIPGKENDCFYIGFFDDQQTILVYICSS